MSQKVFQITAGSGLGDAITNYAIEISKLLSNKNIENRILTPKKHIHKDLLGKAVFPLEEFSSQIKEEDLILYHYSIGSKATEIFSQLKANKTICYHNVTPKKYFSNLSPEQEKKLDEGRERLPSIAKQVKLAFAVSEYNRQELLQAGFNSPLILPLTITQDYLKTAPDLRYSSSFSSTQPNLLFVGRIAPNKRQEDLIKTFYYFKQLKPQSKLILAGSFNGNERYKTYLDALAMDLNLTDSIEITGHLPLSSLISCYHSSQAFLCLSEHEGFGVPLIEAMYYGLPVFALDRAAISETLGSAGILIKEKVFPKIAFLIEKVLSDSSLQDQILKQQKKRVEDFSAKNLEKHLFRTLKEANLLKH